jgi:hypothetical protein
MEMIRFFSPVYQLRLSSSPLACSRSMSQHHAVPPHTVQHDRRSAGYNRGVGLSPYTRLQPDASVMAAPPNRLSSASWARAVRRDKALETAYTLTQRFRQMMRERAASTLDLWRVDGLASGMPELVHLASGLPREHSAVQAALELPYSNGQVEGQITKLKLLKRQSYRRAKLGLLRQRMLHAA